MAGPKPAALPLGHAPFIRARFFFTNYFKLFAGLLFIKYVVFPYLCQGFTMTLFMMLLRASRSTSTEKLIDVQRGFRLYARVC